MVPAGDPVDQTIAKLKPFMAKGDIFIDGGNSNYKDSQRRHDELKQRVSSLSMWALPAASGASPRATR